MTKITMIQGTSQQVNLTFLQSDGSPIDLTSGKVYFTVNSDSTPDSDASAAIQKTITAHSDPTLGKTSLTLDPIDTSTLTAGSYRYDAKAIAASGTEVALAQDAFVVKAAITRSIT